MPICSTLMSGLELDKLYRAQARQLQDHAQFLVGTNGRIASWNVGVAYTLGYSEDEFIGQ